MTAHTPAPLEQFESLAAMAPDEVLTTAEVTDHELPGGAGTLALLTPVSYTHLTLPTIYSV